MRRAHTGKFGAHINVPSKMSFAHISYMSDEFIYNVPQKKFYVHADFKKLQGTLLLRLPDS